MVLAGHDERVAREQRLDVEERHDLVVVDHDRGRGVPGDDRAEQARHGRQGTRPGRLARLSVGGPTIRQVDVPLYGLDIETDTEAGGLDPSLARILAVAVSSTTGDVVFQGDESSILTRVDAFLAGLR